MKAIITYYNAKENLAVLLTLLQAQMIMPEEITKLSTIEDIYNFKQQKVTRVY